MKVEESAEAIFASARKGDPQAVGRLYELLYPELRRVAHARLRGQADVLLNTTMLVHESYERLAGSARLDFADQAHFLAYAAHAMRSVLVDLARERLTERRGGGAQHLAITTGLGERLVAKEQPELLRVHEALEELEQIEPRLAQVVELRYFGGLSDEEISAAMQRSLRSVGRDWERARSYLYDVLKAD